VSVKELAAEVFEPETLSPPAPVRPAAGDWPGEVGALPDHAGAPTPANLSDVRVFAIANQKGGVGKTTTAVNLAAAVAAAGYSALIVDIDPQANATVGLGQPRTLSPNVYDVLCGACQAEEAVHETPVDRLWLMPAGAGLVGASVELPTVAGSEQRLRHALAALRERFAFIMIDCPPSLGPLTVNALVAADRVIVPVQTEYFALEGLAQVLDTISLIQREFNPHLSVAGMLLTMHDNRTGSVATSSAMSASTSRGWSSTP
jgi:chromosome partitioning protein